jgi:hypothetical protein
VQGGRGVTTAARLRRFRERRAEGRAVLSVEVNLLDLTEMLVTSGLLRTWDDNDRGKVERAVERLLGILIAESKAKRVS